MGSVLKLNSFLFKRSYFIKSILKQTSLAIIRERIHHTRKTLDYINRMTLTIHLEVTNTLRNEDWDCMERVMAARLVNLWTHVVEIQQSKFERL